MIWQSPWWLWALLIVPVLGVLGVVWARDRERAGREYANPGLMPVGATRRRRRFRAVAFVLALLAVACGPVALARPSIDRTHKQERSVVMIAIDTSRSMQKTDLQPSRLAAALDAAKRFIDVVPKHTQVGLLSFAKSARVIAAPTDDRAALDRILQHWPPTAVGTAIGDALVTSLGAIQATGVLSVRPATPADSPARVLLLTDGAQSAGTVEPQDAGERAKAQRVPVYTFLLGDDPGRPDQPSPPETLSALATQTGGRYSQSITSNDLRNVVEDIGSSLAPVRKLDELTVYVVLAAVLLLAAAAGALALGGPARPAPRRLGVGSASQRS
jgi:Ca-activated chloride channel homolog